MNVSKIKEWMSKPVHIGALVFFRIIFGVVMFVEVNRFFIHNWIERYYMEPSFYFTYEGFSWLQPWPGIGMKIHFIVLGILALCIALGLFYRYAMTLFFLGFTYVFLLDKTNYLNHFYLISLLSFIMIFMPANKAFSLDAKRNPNIKSEWIPNWTLWWLKIQLGIAYFYGGIAKLNSDWFQAQPIGRWLERRQDFPIIGQFFDLEWVHYFFAYSGLLLDLLVVPFLLIKRTRLIAFIVISTFHLMNSRLFVIGIFPWFMLGATAIFFPSEKFRFWKGELTEKTKSFKLHKIIVPGLGIYMAIQLLIPFRHLLFKGNVNWTEEGHRFAWHMKLRSKINDAQFYITDLDNKRRYPVDLKNFLSTRQIKKIKGKPDMVVQFAKHLEKYAKQNGYTNVAVTAEIYCRLNYRPKALLIDPNVDLSKINYPFYKKADWILPLEVPLKVE